MKNASVIGLVLFTLLLALPTLVHAQLTGKYSDGKLTAEFNNAADGSFTGTLTLNGKPFAATAHSGQHGFEGSFNSGAESFTFTATLDGDNLTLVTGGATYNLKRTGGKNPLAQPANPPAGNTNITDDSPAGYTVESSTEFGRSLVARKPDAKTVQSAFESTFPDLAKYFGDRPVIGKAYEDAADHKSGAATFSATFKGQAIKGFVSAKLTDTGANVAIIFDRADAGKADWDKLTSPPASTASTPPPTQTIDASSVLGTDAQTVEFSDGTGTIKVAKGWKTEAQSAINPIFIAGPSDQSVVIGNVMNVQTPDSPLMKMIAQNQAMMRRMGRNPPPPAIPILVAEFTDPIQAMSDLGPQINKYNQEHGQPTGHLDQIVSHEDIPCDLQNGKACIICWDVTRTYPDGRVLPMRGLGTVHMATITQGVWMYCFTGCIAPRASFDHDKPLMLAMIKSETIDANMASQRIRERSDQQMAMLKQQGDAQNAQLQRNHDQFMQDQARRFAQGQAQHAEQMAGYEQHNQQFKDYELQKSRNNADFVETIRGTRTIYDTKTGQTATADLNYATGVVDSLNDAALDPTRFVQIPLRDEMYPVPAK